MRARQRRNVMAVKGSSADGGAREIFALPKPIDQHSKTKVAKYGLRTYIVGTHKAKELLIGGKGRVTLTGRGPGRMHFYQGVRADFFEQLMSEVLVPNRSKRGAFEWKIKSGTRNEALDCTVMALHAARSVKTHSMTPQAWAALEAKLMQLDVFAEPPAAVETVAMDEETAAAIVPPEPVRRIKRKAGGFVGKWR